jgi:hypothetical protein
MKRPVCDEAMLDAAFEGKVDRKTIPPSEPPPAESPSARRIPLPLSWVGSSKCPVCQIVHEGSCSKFWDAWKARNDEIAKRLQPVRPIHLDAARARLALLKRARAMALQCRTKEQIIAVLDDLVKACIAEVS